MTDITKIVLFKNKQVRKILHNNEWYFSVIDVIEVLTDSLNSKNYWSAMKTRVKLEDGIELSTICRQLKLPASDGKKLETRLGRSIVTGANFLKNKKTKKKLK